jgi:hypothetical protein
MGMAVVVIVGSSQRSASIFTRAMMFIVAVRRTVGRLRTFASTVDFSRHVTSYNYYYVT